MKASDRCGRQITWRCEVKGEIKFIPVANVYAVYIDNIYHCCSPFVMEARAAMRRILKQKRKIRGEEA